MSRMELIRCGVGKVRAGTASDNGGLGIIGGNNGKLGAFLVYPGGTHGKIQAPGIELIVGKEAICFLAVAENEFIQL